MGAAMGAAGLSEDLGFQLPTGVKADTSAIDIPLTQQTSNLQPNLPVSQSYSQVVTEDPAQQARHIFQPRFATQSAIPQQQQPLAPAPQSSQKYQKLTFNSGANYSAQPPAPAPIQKKTVAQKQKRTVPSTDMQIGPDQQKVTYTVTSENGYSQTYMMICSKTLDQNTLINTLIKNISNDPNHKGKKTIKITQHKYGAKKSAKAGQQQQQGGRVVQGPRQQLVASSTVQQGRQVQQQQQQQQRRVQPVAARAQARPLPQGQHVQQRQQQQQLQPARQQLQQVQQQQPAQQASQPPRQILQSEPDIGPEPVSSQQDHFTDSLSLDDIVSQIGGGGEEGGDGEPRVMVRCNYCTNFRSVLNSQTWENILNHILPVAKEELHTSFYGNILKHFARSLRVAVSGKGSDQVEVVVSHGLVCRRTGAWYSVDR